MSKKGIEDLKETAPCGMLIHYTVNSDDVITYNDINGKLLKKSLILQLAIKR